MRIRDVADPLSDEARTAPDKVILAHSESLDLLHEDLARYCDGRILGRSILVSGHRGSGKTTLVEDAIRESRRRVSNRPAAMRPLPIFLHGPSLLKTWPSDMWRLFESTKRKNGDAEKPDPSGEEEPAQPATVVGDSSNRDPVKPATPPKEKKTASAAKGLAEFLASSTKQDWEEEAHAWTALEHIILGIHRAVTREFVYAYREFVGDEELFKLEPEAGEMAAAFEIELLEDPPAWRLREFWSEPAR